MYRPPKSKTAPTDLDEDRSTALVEPLRIWVAIRNGRQALLAAALLGAFLGIVAGLQFVSPVYESSAILLWMPQAASGESGGAGPQPTGWAARFLGSSEEAGIQTVVDSVKLPSILREVRRELGLNATLEQLARRIQVSSGENSRLLTIRAQGQSRSASRALAQSTVDAFLSDRRRLRAQEAARQVRLAESAVNAAGASFQAAWDRWESFCDANGVSDLMVERQLRLQRSADLRSRADNASAEVRSETARLSGFEAEAWRHPSTIVLSVNETDPGLTRLAEARRERRSLETLLGETSPEVVALSAEVETLNHRRDPPVQASRSIGRNPQWESLTTARRESEGRIVAADELSAALEALLEENQARVRNLNHVEGQSRRFAAALEVATARLLSSEDALRSAQLEEARVDVDLTLVGAPQSPDRPMNPVRRYVVVLAVVVFLLVTLGGLIAKTLWGARLRCPSEIARWTALPVLGSTIEDDDDDVRVERVRAAMALPTRVPALIGELADRITPLPGATLVVALHDSVRLDAAQIVSAVQERLTPNGTLVRLWEGESQGAALRAACRGVERVVALVQSGEVRAYSAARTRISLGRDEGVGLVVIGVGLELAACRDQAGDVHRFWLARSSQHAGPPVPAMEIVQ